VKLKHPPGRAMTLGNMRALGVKRLIASQFPAHLIYLRERANAAMVANANEAATPPPATQIALADLFGCSHSNRTSTPRAQNQSVKKMPGGLYSDQSFLFFNFAFVARSSSWCTRESLIISVQITSST
jgi:hypothetical protein